MLGVAAALAAGCAGPPPLEHVQPSPEVLARQVLQAVERRDAAALRALAVDEEEFTAHVWPSLPAARRERNLPLSYVWGQLRQKSEHQLAATLAAHGGRPYDLVRVDFGGATVRYAGYAVHRDTTLVVRTREGLQERLRLYGSTLEKDGAFKVFSYVVE